VEVKDVMEDVAEVGRFTLPITFVPAGIGSPPIAEIS
jgi:hypothetical protein